VSQKQIFPVETIEFSTEYHHTRNTVKSQIIYTTIVLSIIAAIISLPFIFIDITVQADGLIRPVNEKTDVKSMHGGIVENIYVDEGRKVLKGDTILSMLSDEVESKIEFAKFQIEQNTDFIFDINELIKSRNSKNLKTAYYIQKNVEYKQKLTELNNKLRKFSMELERNEPLYNKGVIASQTFDNIVLSYESVKSEIWSFKESYKNLLQGELIQKENDLQKYSSQLEQLDRQKDYYVIKAPISGTLEQFSGIYTGTNIQAGQTITIISPSSEIIAEVYISPNDIGFIKLGNKANIQVHAFNYNDWGMLQAEIIEISNDYILMGEQPFFRVRCKLDKTWLQLKNGFKGELKKGMTVRSRFIVTKRSLWQILFDNINDWMNPALNEVEN